MGQYDGISRHNRMKLETQEDALKRENDRLRMVVSKLHKTADGEPVVPFVTDVWGWVEGYDGDGVVNGRELVRARIVASWGGEVFLWKVLPDGRLSNSTEFEWGETHWYSTEAVARSRKSFSGMYDE